VGRNQGAIAIRDKSKRRANEGGTNSIDELATGDENGGIGSRGQEMGFGTRILVDDDRIQSGIIPPKRFQSECSNERNMGSAVLKKRRRGKIRGGPRSWGQVKKSVV